MQGVEFVSFQDYGVTIEFLDIIRGAVLVHVLFMQDDISVWRNEIDAVTVAYREKFLAR